MSFIAPENIEFRDGRPQSTTKSGVPYVTFITRAVVPEATPYPPGEETEEEAWAVFNETVGAYLAQEKAKVVEWRTRPAVDDLANMKKKNPWQIRARLAVTETTDGA